MARIFISHSSKDNDKARVLLEWLRGRGFDSTFLDFDKHAGIRPGADWLRTIFREVTRADAVVLLVTNNWMDSKWCFFEYGHGRALGKEVFPLLDDVDGTPSIAPDLQHLDLRHDRDEQLERLAVQLTELALTARGGFAWDMQRAPYPGLHAYEEQDAAIYFGRDEERRRLIERLNARRIQGGTKLVALLGASGSGKSSLMHAGIAARLKRDRRNWIVLPPFRPQTHPLDELAQSIAQALGPRSDWRQVLEQLTGEKLGSNLRALARDLRTTHASNDAQILILIDQGEELFSIAETSQAETFWASFDAMLNEHLPFIALLGMRSDFLDKLQKIQALHAPFEEFSLKPLPVERWRDIVEGPARVACLDIESALTTAIVDDAATDDALPLLAFALRELYDDFGKSGRLTVEGYRALGDHDANLSPLENAVRRKADEVLADAKPNDDELKALKNAFIPGMVRVNAEGEFVRRPAEFDKLPAASWRLIERLAGPNARLLVLRQERSKRVVEVAHEALLRRWPLLRGWLDEERDFLIGKQQLEQDLEDWEKADDGAKPDALLSGLKLNRARAWLERQPQHLSEDEHTFIQASIARQEAEAARRERTWRRILAGSIAASIILLVAAATTAWQWRESVRERDRATTAKELGDKQLATQSNVLANFARESARAGDHTTAMLLALEGLPNRKRGIDRPYVEAAYTALIDSITERREALVFGGDLKRTANPTFVGRDKRILTTEYGGPHVLRDSVTGAEVVRSPPWETRYRRALVSPDGSRFVVWSEYPFRATLWDARSGKELGDLGATMERATALSFSPRGNFIVAAGSDDSVTFWSAESGRISRRMAMPGFAALVVLNADESRMVTSIAHEMQLWDLGSGTPIARIKQDPTIWLDQNLGGPDSQLGPLLAGTEGNDVVLIDVRTGTRKALLRGHTAGVRSIRLAPDGERVITASDDGTARIWKISTGEQTGVVTDREYPLKVAYFDPTGTRIVTVGGTRYGASVIHSAIARLWDASSLSPVTSLVDAKEYKLFGDPEFNRDGSRLLVHTEVTGSTSGDTPRYAHTLWDTTPGTALTSNKDNFSPRFSHDTRLLLRVTDTTVRILDVNNTEEIAVLAGHTKQVTHAAFSDDDRRVVTSSDDETGRIWTIVDRADAQATFEGMVLGDWGVQPTTDPNRVLVVSGHAAQRRAYLWDFATRSIRKHIDIAQMPMVVTGDGSTIALAADDRTIRILRGEDLTETTRLGPFERAPTRLDSDAAGKRLTVRFGEDAISVYDTAAWRETASFKSPGGRFLRLSPNSEYASTVSDNNVVTVLSSHQTVGVIPEDASMKDAMILDPSRVATVLSNDAAHLWDAAQSRKIADLGRYVESTPDERYIVTKSDKHHLWNVSSGQIVADLKLQDKAYIKFLRDERLLTLEEYPDRSPEKQAVMRVLDPIGGRPATTLFEALPQSFTFLPHREFFGFEFDAHSVGWSLDTLQRLYYLNGKAIALSPNRDWLLAQLPPRGKVFLTQPLAGPEQAVDAAVERVPRCLTPEQRASYYLEATPPLWCIERAKWPYAGQAWKDWLGYRARNIDPPLPDTPEWRAWLQTNASRLATGASH